MKNFTQKQIARRLGYSLSTIEKDFRALRELVNPMRVKSDFFKILESLKAQPAKIHDIKIKFHSNIHEKLAKIGFEQNPQNKGIRIEYSPINDNRFTIKGLIYPNTVQIDVACTNYPLIFDIPSLFYLHELLKEFSIHLYEISTIRPPSVKDWVITHYHLNRDGNCEINGERFNMTTGDHSEGMIRYYSKIQPDGTCKPRLEIIKTPKITLEELMKIAIK